MIKEGQPLPLPTTSKRLRGAAAKAFPSLHGNAKQKVGTSFARAIKATPDCAIAFCDLGTGTIVSFSDPTAATSFSAWLMRTPGTIEDWHFLDRDARGRPVWTTVENRIIDGAWGYTWLDSWAAREYGLTHSQFWNRYLWFPPYNDNPDDPLTGIQALQCRYLGSQAISNMYRTNYRQFKFAEFPGTMMELANAIAKAEQASGGFLVMFPNSVPFYCKDIHGETFRTGPMLLALNVFRPTAEGTPEWLAKFDGARASLSGWILRAHADADDREMVSGVVDAAHFVQAVQAPEIWTEADYGPPAWQESLREWRLLCQHWISSTRIESGNLPAWLGMGVAKLLEYKLPRWTDEDLEPLLSAYRLEDESETLYFDNAYA